MVSPSLLAEGARSHPEKADQPGERQRHSGLGRASGACRPGCALCGTVTPGGGGTQTLITLGIDVAGRVVEGPAT